MDFKSSWDTSLDNATRLVKENKVITGIIAGGVSGTILFPIPIIGTVLGAIVGAKIAEKTEVVFFGRSGADVTPDAGKRTRSIGPDESQYAERRIVRLEVWKKSKNELIRDIKEAVSASLDEKRETHTVSDVDVGRPAFLVHITKPKDIRQLVVEGTQTMFMFTGADEEQLVSHARGIK